MSDPNTPPADEARDEERAADDQAQRDAVVDRANEALAEAEAARADVAASPVDERLEHTRTPSEPVEAVIVEEVVVEEQTPVPSGDAWYDVPRDETPDTAADGPADYPTAATYPAVVGAEGYVAQPIFVQAPEPPRPRGNRAAAGLIGLVAALGYALITFGVLFGAGFAVGAITSLDAGEAALQILGSWVFWMPVAIFFLGFWLLGAILNRAAWGHWVVWGLLVGVIAYGGYLLGTMFQAPFWMLTARQGAALIESQLFSPVAILSFVVGRELTVWFGAWVAARGRRVGEDNARAQREYERTLEAGPQLARP